MTTSKGDDMQVNDIVIFSPRQGETAEGIVTRVWDKPASDPYVTIKRVGLVNSTYVRCSSETRQSGAKTEQEAFLAELGRQADRRYAEYVAHQAGA